MYIYVMKPKRFTNHYSRVMIYLHELNLEYECNNTYYLITELVDGEPNRTFYYKIPESYKDNRLLGEMHERYCPYCPN